MTANGNNSILNINAPVTRTAGSGTLIIGAGGTGGRVNVNAPLDNNGGSVALHNGAGTVAFNVSGHNIGDMNVQYSHMLQLGISDALPSNRYLNVGSASTYSSTPEMGTFDMAGYDQAVNGLKGSGNNSDASTRVVKNSGAGLSTLTVGANNGSATFDGMIVDNIDLIKSGSGTQIFSGTRPNTYSGATTINGGILQLSKSAGTNAIPGALTVGAGRVSNSQDHQIADNATVTMTTDTSRWELYGHVETIANLDMQNADPTVNEGYISGGAGKLTVTGTLTHVLGHITLNSSGTGGESVITANKVVNMGGDWTFGVTAGTQNLNIGSGGLEIGGGSEIYVNANATCPNFVTLSGDVTSLANAEPNTISGAGRVILNGICDFNVADGSSEIDMEVSAILTNGTPSGSLIKSGSGVLFLSGSNTYTGGTSVTAGTLAIEDTNALPGWDTALNYSVASGAALVSGNSITDGNIATMLGTGNFAAGASMGFDTSDGDRIYTPNITDTGAGSMGVIKSGANMLTLTGANTYTGTTKINAGELNIDEIGALPGWNTAGRYSVASGVALIVQNAVTDANVTTMLDTGNFLSGATIGFDTSAGDRTYNNVISNSVNGELNVDKVGINTLFLSGDNSYDGTTTLDGGRITIRHNNALGSTNGITVVNRVGGTSENSYTDATGQLLLDGDGGDIVINENFRINGAEQYGYGGSLRNSRGNNTINGWIELGPNGGRIGLSTGNLTLNGPIRPREGVTPALLVFNPSSGTITINNTVDSGTRNTLFHSGGTVLLNTNGHNWGEAQIQYSSKVMLGIDDAMVVSKRVIFGNSSGGNGTININGFNQTIGGVYMYGTAASLPNNLIRNTDATKTGTFIIKHLTAVDQTFSGRIIEAVNFVKDGVADSILTLTGTNTFTGTTEVDGGTLILGNEWALQNSTFNDTTSEGTLSFGSGFTEFTFGGLAGSSDLGLTNASGVAINLIVGNNSSDTMYNGVLAAGGSLTKIGTGTLTLSGENTFSGTTTVTNGTLALGCDNALSAGSQVVLSGGTLDAGAFANSLGVLSVTGDSSIDLSDGAGSLAFADSSSQTWSGALNIEGSWLPYTLRVGTSSSGLTKTQLNSITVDSESVWVQIDNEGYLWKMTGTLIIVR
jgi:fibronectin-binding autotransporter adhesin